MTDLSKLSAAEIPEDFVLVEFTRGGAIAPRGLGTGNRYRRVGQGDRFYVDPADLAAEPSRKGGAWFVAVVEEKPVSTALAEETATTASRKRSSSKKTDDAATDEASK